MTETQSLDPATPVLVGWAAVSQREDDATTAREPIDLMIDATRAAARRAASERVLATIECIYTPRGRWSYANPGGEIGRAVGAPHARTVLSTVGVLQQTLIGDACRRIRDGELGTALVVGGEAGYRLLRARIADVEIEDRQQRDEPGAVWSPEQELRHPAELRVGLQMPIGIYCMAHSAFRAQLGRSVAEHRHAIAELWSGFSEVAAANPDAWNRQTYMPEEVEIPSERNPMQAFPYTRRMCSSWSVDQAGALIFCSIARARELGIPESSWIYPISSTESNYMAQASTRTELWRVPGAAIAGREAVSGAGLNIEDIDLFDLYSAFPAAVELYGSELGVPVGRPLTVTGGMSFAGGPYNNYTLQAVCRMADLLQASQRVPSGGGAGRQAPRLGLISNASGVLTKQAFGIWSDRPAEGFYWADVTEAVKRESRTRAVTMEYEGEARVDGETVLYTKGKPDKAVVIATAPDGKGVVAESADPLAIERIEASGVCGNRVRVSAGQFFDFET
ncbi:MAG: hypothetical protein TEF_18780 [Rhizobiales bacterium NRL2]|jgi:acetyl-CoA C-acetyltransferase|nr:MAG: hypothetical protein TEF_18780 [Rhizobiales bacterium NRL2]